MIPQDAAVQALLSLAPIVDVPEEPIGLSRSRASRADAPRVAFVSTNTISQGEQVGILWGWNSSSASISRFTSRIALSSG